MSARGSALRSLKRALRKTRRRKRWWGQCGEGPSAKPQATFEADGRCGRKKRSRPWARATPVREEHYYRKGDINRPRKSFQRTSFATTFEVAYLVATP